MEDDRVGGGAVGLYELLDQCFGRMACGAVNWRVTVDFFIFFNVQAVV